MMDVVKALFASASAAYSAGRPHHESCLSLARHCLEKLRGSANFRPYGSFDGLPAVPYSVFETDGCLSRPIRADLFLTDPLDFRHQHDRAIACLTSQEHVWEGRDYEQVDRVVYTAVMSVACCFDLWQRSSRKTPGTFFEFFTAGMLKAIFPEASLSKHVPLPAIADGVPAMALEGGEEGESGSVSTDLVVAIPGRVGGFVIPLKITTRERIVQPFAHQRILDSAFGKGHFRSLILCISETQLDSRSNSVKQVCVPGTIKLFQRYLAPIHGIYYCDIPQRYASPDMAAFVRIRSVGQFFGDLRELLGSLTEPAGTE